MFPDILQERVYKILKYFIITGENLLPERYVTLSFNVIFVIFENFISDNSQFTSTLFNSANVTDNPDIVISIVRSYFLGAIFLD